MLINSDGKIFLNYKLLKESEDHLKKSCLEHMIKI